jgi:hypothetical protein
MPGVIKPTGYDNQTTGVAVQGLYGDRRVILMNHSKPWEYLEGGEEFEMLCATGYGKPRSPHSSVGANLLARVLDVMCLTHRLANKLNWPNESGHLHRAL